MPNGTYGRLVPRLALAVAQYRGQFGEWPTHASGSWIAILLHRPGEGADPNDVVEFSPELAAAIQRRLQCDATDRTHGILLTGPSGRSEGFGLIARDTAQSVEAYRWLYGRDPWWADRVDSPD